MSNILLRRNSNKQSLQNLMRLTAQRSIEDAEEAERECRRRAREASLRKKSSLAPGDSSPENEMSAEETAYDGVLKPNGSPCLEEDEGFSDWTQRQERRRQQHLQEVSQAAEEDTEEDTGGAKPEHTVQSSVSGRLQRRQEEESDQMETERRKRQEEEAMDRVRRETRRTEEEKRRREEQMMVTKRREEIHRPVEAEKREEVKVSYTSKVFLKQEPKYIINAQSDAHGHMTTYLNNNKTKRSNRSVDQEEAEPILEPEQRLEKIQQIQQEKEIQEQLRHRQAEAEQELEELKRRREERRRVREEEARHREEEEERRRAEEEQQHRLAKEDEERRRMKATERMKSLSTSSVDGDENFSPFSPKTPTHRISERTESLNRSLKKSNSFKKSQPLGLLPKIDDKLEQYAHAVETSHEARTVKAVLTDLPSPPEAVASKKNLFEAGEGWSQSSAKAASCKDADGLKVGVANRITQWAKSTSDGGGRQSTCRSADVKSGDVMQKKNMWEIIGDSSGRAGLRAKGSAGSKRYKFVVTGHGKYEKVSVDEDGEELTHGKSGFSDY